MASLKASSHLKRYSSVHPCYTNESTQSLFQIHLGGLTKCSSYPGLTIMSQYFYDDTLKKIPVHSQKVFKRRKSIQLKDFSRDMSSGNDLATLVVLLSNDYKTFLSKDGKMIPLTRYAKKHFEKLTSEQKAAYNTKDHNPLQKSSREHLENQFQAYENILKPILAKSNLEYFYHSSVLERLNPKIACLPLYFAILNSFLKRKLNYWNLNETFKNRHGKPIRCIFVCVRKQFFKAENPPSLFIDKEVKRGGELTHRKDWALDDLVRDWKKALSPHIPPS